MYLPVNLPPGVFAVGTALQAKGRWRLSDHVRWPEGANLQPIGGYVPRGAATTGKPRALIGWKENLGTRWIGIGTHSKLMAQSASAANSDITPAGFSAGASDATTGGGYGAATYGAGTYGTSRPDTGSITPASVWTLDTWGQHLVGCMEGDGKLYEWALNTAVPAAAMSGAPTGCNGLVVTAERFVMALKGRTVIWCDQGDNTSWTASATNQAGDQDLDTFGTLMCGRRVTGATLLFTDVDVWRATYQGLPTVYGFERVGADCGPVAKGAVVALDARCVWMGKDGFYLYDGFTAPLPSDVGDYVFSDFNATQASKVSAFHNSAFGEVWWFYPSGASNENDRYAVWHYRSGRWWIGTLARTAGMPAGVFKYPVCAAATGQLYEHEQGWTWGVTPFARSAPVAFEGAAGGPDKRLMVKGFVADEASLGESEVEFFGRDFPNGAETTFGSYPIAREPVDVLFQSRLIELEVRFTQPADARAGITHMDIQPVSSR